MTDLERRLHEAAAYFELPPTPDVAAAVTGLLPARPARDRRRPALVAVAVALAASVAALAVSDGARSGVLGLLDLVPGVEIERTERLPPAVAFARFEPVLGRRVGVSQARREATFTLRLPAHLPPPDDVYLDRTRAGDAVTTVYGRGDGRARLVLSQWHPARLLFRKLVRLTRVEVVRVEGPRGLWISGPDHEVFYVGGDGVRRRGPPYLAGNTLIWARGGTTYRLEADVSRADALAFARSLEP